MKYFLISCFRFFLLILWRDAKDGSQASYMLANTLPMSHTVSPVKFQDQPSTPSIGNQTRDSYARQNALPWSYILDIFQVLPFPFQFLSFFILRQNFTGLLRQALKSKYFCLSLKNHPQVTMMAQAYIPITWEDEAERNIVNLSQP